MHLKKNFQAMPGFLKFIFIIDVIGVFTTILQGPNTSLVKWILGLVISIFGIYVFMRRSYSLLVKYTIISILSFLIFTWFPLYNNTTLLPASHQAFYMRSAVITHTVIFLFSLFIWLYTLRQKQYFNKP